jgi:hypothetical protein
MSARHTIATAFGRHSRPVWRAVVGASWTLPLRFAVLSGQIAAVAAVSSATGQLSPAASASLALSAGVAVGWLASLADRLAVELAIFPAIRRFFVRDAAPH